MTKVFSRSNWLFAALFLLVVGAAIFRSFLFGDLVLLYTDIGSDSANVYYPMFVHLSDYIRAEGFPSWSFCVGMGQDLALSAAYLIWQPVTWLPKDLIAPALVYQHLGKVLVAGLLIFRFLQLRRLQSPAPLLGSLLVSFSGYMCMSSCWFNFADEVVCFCGLLWAVEEAVQNRRWIFLIIPVGLAGMITPFHLYLCALFLSLYVPARLFGQHGVRLQPILRTCAILGGVTVLGIGVGAVVILPYLGAILGSPRGSGVTSWSTLLRSSSVFHLESSLHYVTAVLRSFSNDFLGTAENYSGWRNYFEAPATYCGLLCLLVVPQVFVRAPRRHAVIYAGFLGGVLLLTILPWFRYLFWLFQGDYYRAVSLFSMLGVVTLSSMVWSRYAKGERLNLWLLAATTITVVSVLYVPIPELQAHINRALRLQAMIFLLSYAVLVTAGQILRRQLITAWVVVGLVAFELVQFDYVTVSDRKTVTSTTLSQPIGYNDQTIDAVRDLKASDPGFFRLTKFRSSGPSQRFPSLNDAQVFGYYGTSSYSSFNNVNYTNFLTAVGAIEEDSEVATRWSPGLLKEPILSLFAAEKYVLAHDPTPYQRSPHYEFVKQYRLDYLFRNARSLPLGLAFDRYVTEEAFRALPKITKANVLLLALVLPNYGEGQALGLASVSSSALEEEIKTASLSGIVAERRRTGLELTTFKPSRIEGKIRSAQKRVLVVQTPFDRGWQAWQDGNIARVLKVDVGLLGVAVDAGEHQLVLRYRNPWWGYGAAITVVSAGLVGLAVWRWPRLPASL
ncbi:MAG TPA: YfhO family protein [Verrucomicrobiae bacterium]|nr:YfhO family protein [Verrucomicrobiae bacterium]